MQSVCGFYDNWTYRDGGNEGGKGIQELPQCREGGVIPQTDKAWLLSAHFPASKDSY
jgi:hypothetical protein